jgi:hypothetical protein
LSNTDLVEATLKGQGPFMVFAPTDEAFANLPADTLEKLMKPENNAELAAILMEQIYTAPPPVALAPLRWNLVKVERDFAESVADVKANVRLYDSNQSVAIACASANQLFSEHISLYTSSPEALILAAASFVPSRKPRNFVSSWYLTESYTCLPF